MPRSFFRRGGRTDNHCNLIIMNKILFCCVLALSVPFQSVLHASDTLKVHNTVIPVMLGRDYNVVAEFCVECSAPGAVTLDDVRVRVGGLPDGALGNVSLVYTGTMSALYSRTTSYVIKDAFYRMGASQRIYCDPGYAVVKDSETDLRDGRAVLHAGQGDDAVPLGGLTEGGAVAHCVVVGEGGGLNARQRAHARQIGGGIIFRATGGETGVQVKVKGKIWDKTHRLSAAGQRWSAVTAGRLPPRPGQRCPCRSPAG